jgi:hypothetical protein
MRATVAKDDKDKRRYIAELRLSMRASSASAIKKEEWYARKGDQGMNS